MLKPRDPVTSDALRSAFSDCYDFAERVIYIGGQMGKKATLMYIDGLTSGSDISEAVVRPLSDAARFPRELPVPAAIELITGGAVYNFSANRRSTLTETVSDMLNGFCAVVFDAEKCAVTFEVRSSEKRGVDAPKEEKVVKGAKDAFTETLKVNTTLVRRKLKNPNLKIRELAIGDKTDTAVTVIYIDGFTSETLVREAERRLAAIDAEGLLSSAVIEERIADCPSSPFPQLITTERPDKFCLNLLEGRVGILADSLPIGFLAPATFPQFMKAPEDHAYHYIISSFLTLLRYFSFILAVLAPAFYVAVAMYHQEMIPIELMQSMIDAKRSVPFPTAFEVTAMLIAFDLLQEAGVRLPSPIGQTVSIIGALIVGQSAVEAKVVSPVVVVVIALSGIAGYTMPNQDMAAAVRICRFLLVVLAVFSGMFGLAVGIGLTIYHLAGIESFGVAYMSPFAGSEGKHAARALLRFSMRKKRDAEPEILGEDRGKL